MKTQLFFLFMFALSAGKIFAQPVLNPKPADLLETNFSEHTLIENL